MGLTKEECKKAYSELQTYEYELFGQQEMVHSNVFLSLIEEHFNNPPLKFEELEEGMWVWDNSVYEKNYALIKRKFMCGDDFVVAMKQDEGKCEDGDDYLGRAFEDNRFYRREVHDE